MPARFQLIGATNPCPCGAGAPAECRCDERVRHRYMARLSGPLLDRFDLRVTVDRPEVDDMLDGAPGESTAEVAARVAAARAVAVERSGRLNAELDDAALRIDAPLSAGAEAMLRSELERGRLTGRGYHRVRRTARTLADLAGELDGEISEGLVANALMLRARVGLATTPGAGMTSAPLRAEVEGCVAALARLPYVGSARLRLLLSHHEPSEALAAFAGRARLHPMVLRAFPADQLARAMAAASSADPDAEVAACRAAGARVLVWGTPAFPAALQHDPDPPGVVFVCGDTAALGHRRVGIVGTRNATASGLATARELGAALAEAGVSVVSGLARGVDGAAHTGVRRASASGRGRPVAVVGSGPDVVYPRRHADLWHWVATSGLLVSEWPPGTEPDAWRFPRTQSHHRRAERGAGRRREPRTRRQPHHRPPRRRSWDRSDGGARLTPVCGERWHQPVAA